MIHQNRVFVACPARSNFALSLMTDHCRLTCRQRRFLYIQLDASLNTHTHFVRENQWGPNAGHNVSEDESRRRQSTCHRDNFIRPLTKR